MFPLQDSVSPIELGIGLGATEGIVFGIIAGLIVVVAIAWKETRMLHGQSSPPP